MVAKLEFEGGPGTQPSKGPKLEDQASAVERSLESIVSSSGDSEELARCFSLDLWGTGTPIPQGVERLRVVDGLVAVFR